MLSLCDFSDPDILVNRTITVTGTGNNTTERQRNEKK